MAIGTTKYFNANDFTVFTVTHALRGVTNFFGFFSKDGSKQPLFAGQLLFALRGNLANQNVAWMYFGANSDNTVLIKVTQSIFRNVWNVTGYDFRSELGLADFHHVINNVN